MNYYELLFTTITTEDYQQDLLINALAEIGFDTFEEVDFGFKAFIEVTGFDKDRLENCLSGFRELFMFDYEITLIPGKNWNAVWESNFEPINIKDKIYLRATFHEPKPGFPYEIVIDPKMAFGTGHHQTTAMMLAYILEEDIANRCVLDMGCGTGVLAIMAAKAGAREVTAIDNDQICYESTTENSRLNKVTNILTICGSKEAIPDGTFDIILANINRNILLDQLKNYATALVSGGTLLMSGFYLTGDLDMLISEAAKLGFAYVSHKADSNWAAVKFIC